MNTIGNDGWIESFWLMICDGNAVHLRSTAFSRKRTIYNNYKKVWDDTFPLLIGHSYTE